MISGKFLVLGLVVLLVGLFLIDLRLSRSKYSRLAGRFGRKPENANKADLGMEAADLEKVAGILQRNAALARKTGSEGSTATWTAAAAAAPPPFPEDETYAARYSGTHEERN